MTHPDRRRRGRAIRKERRIMRDVRSKYEAVADAAVRANRHIRYLAVSMAGFANALIAAEVLREIDEAKEAQL